MNCSASDPDGLLLRRGGWLQESGWLPVSDGPMKLRLCGLIANMGEGVSDAELALRCQSGLFINDL